MQVISVDILGDEDKVDDTFIFNEGFGIAKYGGGEVIKINQIDITCTNLKAEDIIVNNPANHIEIDFKVDSLDPTSSVFRVEGWDGEHEDKGD